MTRHKYGAIRTTVDGREFPSKAEAQRYSALKLEERAGIVRNLKLQPRFDLIVNGVNCGFYKADFSYETPINSFQRGIQWIPIVEDVKGRDTPLSALKRKLVKAIHGVDVRLVTGKGAPITPKKKGRPRASGNPAHAPAT